MNSLYDVTKKRTTDITRAGYLYGDDILLKNTDINMWKNPSMEEFRKKIEPVLSNLLRAVKSLKLAVNFAVRKDEEKANN